MIESTKNTQFGQIREWIAELFLITGIVILLILDYILKIDCKIIYKWSFQL